MRRGNKLYLHLFIEIHCVCAKIHKRINLKTVKVLLIASNDLDGTTDILPGQNFFTGLIPVTTNSQLGEIWQVGGKCKFWHLGKLSGKPPEAIPD